MHVFNIEKSKMLLAINETLNMNILYAQKFIEIPMSRITNIRILWFIINLKKDLFLISELSNIMDRQNIDVILVYHSFAFDHIF